MLCRELQTAHKAYVYKQLENILGATWNCKENNTKNKCIVNNAFFLQNVILESRAI